MKYINTFFFFIFFVILHSNSIAATKNENVNRQNTEDAPIVVIDDLIKTIEQLKIQNMLLEERNKALNSNIYDVKHIFFGALSFAAMFLIFFLGSNSLVTWYRNKKNLELLKDKLDLDVCRTKKELTQTIKEPLENKIIQASKTFQQALLQSKMDIVDLKILIFEKNNEKCIWPSLYLKNIENIIELDLPNWEWKITKYLKKIRKSLENGCPFDETELPEVFDILEKVPSNCKEVANEIKKVISD